MPLCKRPSEHCALLGHTMLHPHTPLLFHSESVLVPWGSVLPAHSHADPRATHLLHTHQLPSKLPVRGHNSVREDTLLSSFAVPLLLPESQTPYSKPRSQT